MAVKPENKFRKWFIVNFMNVLNANYKYAKIRVQKHADYVTQGIPDLDIGVNGMTCWIEVKCVDTCSLKGRRLDVTELQRSNIESAAQAGIPAGVLVGLKSQSRHSPPYRAAFFPAGSVPTHVKSHDFVPVEYLSGELYTFIEKAAMDCARRFSEERGFFVAPRNPNQHDGAGK